MADPKQEQIEVADRLQIKMLNRWERLLDKDNLSPTDAATLYRALKDSGWSLDPARLPKGLRGVIKELKDDPRLIQEDDVDLSRQH